MTPRGYMSLVLSGLGIPATAQNLRAMVGWARIEGGHYNNDAHYNLLNTTLPKPGSSTFRSVGKGAADIRIYKNWAQGVQATIDTLKLPAYAGIRHALRQGSSANAVADAIGASPWGTSASGVRSAIGGTPAQSTKGLPAAPGGSGAPRMVTVPGAPHAQAASTDLTGLAAQLSQGTVVPSAGQPLQSEAKLIPQAYVPPPVSAVTPVQNVSAQLAQLVAGQGLGPDVPHPSSTVAAPGGGASGGGGPAMHVPGTHAYRTTFGGVTETVYASPVAPVVSHAHDVTRLHGLVAFRGVPVAAWIAPVLEYARRQGWQGTVLEGFRTDRQQAGIYRSGVRPAARPQSMGGGGSNHSFQAFPGGAVDVSHPDQLSAIIERSPYRGLLVYAGAKDPVHFSHPHNGGY